MPHYNQDDSRRREDAAVRMEQEFTDWREIDREWKRAQEAKYEADKKSSLEWRAEIEKKINPLVELKETLTTPARILGAVIAMMATPFLGILGWKIGKWILLKLEQMAVQ